MKKMFLKIKKALKKNQLISKISACLMICMILVSSLTVSSFAADEEQATNSITDVWTGVSDSIMSFFGLAKGVFFTNDKINHLERISFGVFTDKSIGSIDDTWFYFTEEDCDPSSAYVRLLDAYYSGKILGLYEIVDSVNDLNIARSEIIYSSEGTSGTLYSLAYVSDGIEPFYVPCLFIGDAGTYYLEAPHPDTMEPVPLTFIMPDFGMSALSVWIGWGGHIDVYELAGGGTELNFLGTLALIGVGLAIILLLVAVISRFIRLRG